MDANCLWFIGQAGIVLEIVGAGLVVYFSYTAKMKMRPLKSDLDHIQEAVDNVLEEVGSQFRKQVTGFVLLVIGLSMQFLGNLANIGG